MSLSQKCKDDPLISIIVPVYNTERYLDTCVESLVQQTYNNIEIILVDDGSASNCALQCDKWQERDCRIKVIHQENHGVAEARNRGIVEAKGDYISFVDSDDWVEPDMCEEAINKALEFNTDVVLWSYIREYKSRSAKKIIFDRDIVFDKEEVRNNLFRRIVGLVGQELAHPENCDAFSAPWGKLFRASTIRDHKLQFTDTKIVGMHEDGLFNFEFFRVAKKAVFLKKYWNHYRKEVDGQLSASYNDSRLNGSKKFFSILNNRISEDQELQKNPVFFIALNNRICLDTISQTFNICRSSMDIIKKRELIQQLLSDSIYEEAFKELSLTYFPIHWKIFFLGCKRKMSGAVLLMVECMLLLKKSIG